MMINGYEILIVSPFDREYLVAEITKGEDFFAELNQEKDFLEIQLYGNKDDIFHVILKEFCDVLNRAKEYLSPSNISSDILKYNSDFKSEKYSNGYFIYYKETKIAKAYFSGKQIVLDIIFNNNAYLLLPFDSFLNILKEIDKLLSCIYLL